MAKAELGTKRVCPETGRKFYDLNRDPIVSPYSGQTYPLSFFEEPEEEEVVPEKEAEAVATPAAETPAETPVAAELDEDGVELVSLEDADDETAGIKDIPELDDDDDTSIGQPSEDEFLETDDDDSDVSDLIVVADDDSEES